MFAALANIRITQTSSDVFHWLLHVIKWWALMCCSELDPFGTIMHDIRFCLVHYLMHHYQPLSRVMWDLLHAQYFLPVGTLSERLEKGGKVVPEDTEVAVEALDASCLVKPTVPELTGAKGQNQDCTTGQCGSHSRRRHPVSGCVVLHVWFCAVWPMIFFLWLTVIFHPYRLYQNVCLLSFDSGAQLACW